MTILRNATAQFALRPEVAIITSREDQAIVVTHPDFRELQAIRSNPGAARSGGPACRSLSGASCRQRRACDVGPRWSGDDATRSKQLKRPLARVEVAAIVTAVRRPAILRRKRHDTR